MSMYYLVYDQYESEEYNYKIFLGVYKSMKEVVKTIGHYSVYNYRVNDSSESVDDTNIKIIIAQTDDYDKLDSLWEGYNIYTRSASIFNGWTTTKYHGWYQSILTSRGCRCC